MPNPIYNVENVELQDNSIKIEFEDDLTGEVRLNDLDLPSSIDYIDKDHLSSTNGIEVKFVCDNGEEEIYPWDYFRATIDEEYNEQLKQENKESLKKLGHRVKQLRKESGLKQQQLAQQAGVGRVTLSRLENGKQSPRFSTLMQIAAALNLPYKQLFE